MLTKEQVKDKLRNEAKGALFEKEFYRALGQKMEEKQKLSKLPFKDYGEEWQKYL